MPQLKLETESGTIPIPTWLWGSIGAVLLLTFGGIGTWVGGTVFDHEKRITVTETRINSIDQSISRIETGVERLDRKLDHVIEALQRPISGPGDQSFFRPGMSPDMRPTTETTELMASFKYYFPGVAPEQLQGAIRDDFLARRNLLSQLGGLTVPQDASANQLHKGPDDGQGMLLIPKSPIDPDQSLIYQPKRQGWLKSTAGEVWIGWELEAPPSPADLLRPQTLEGHQISDAAGQSWQIPIARAEQLEYGFLPTVFTFDAAGEPVRHLVPTHRELWERAGELWDYYAHTFALAAAEQGEEVAVPEAREAWSERWLLHQAVYWLGINHRVGPLEINALFEAGLGPLDGQFAHSVCQAVVDFALLKAAKKKMNTAATTAASPAAGSKSPPGGKDDSPATGRATPRSGSPA